MNRGLTRTIYDQCQIQRDAGDNEAKLKFITTNFTDLENASEFSNVFSIGVRDGMYVPNIDTETQLYKRELSNPRVKTQLGELPLPTMPGKYMQNAFGDAETEKILRYGETVYNYYREGTTESYNTNRNFDIFSEQAPLPTFPVEMENQGGISSRNDFRNAANKL